MKCWSDGCLLDPILHHSIIPTLQSLIVLWQNILRPEFHLPVQAIHRRINDLELEVLYPAFDKFIDAPAYVIDRTENVSVEGELHAVDIALVTLAAGFERRHREIQTFVTRLGDGRELLDGDGDLGRIAAVVARRLI